MSAVMRYAKARSLGMQGDPGLFSTLGKAIKSVGQTWLPNIFPKSSPQTQFGSSKNLPSVFGSPFGPNPFPGRARSGGVPAPITPFPMPDIGGMGWGGGGGGSRAGLKKDGTPRRVKRNGEYYKRPSMNFGNGRAIRRAARRLEGAEKLFRRVFVIRHNKAPAGVHPKRAK